MWLFLLDRAVQGLFALWLVASSVFLLVRLSGDPVALLAGEYATPELEAALRARFGFDQPLGLQYLIYMQRLAQADFGTSIISGEPALKEVLRRWPATLEVAAMGVVITLAFALPIGVYAAVHRGTVVDYLARTFAVVGQSVPAFWLGLIFILVFAVKLRLLPAGGRGGVQHLVLPALTTGWFAMAGIARLTRSSMLEVLGSEYVKLARAKGLSERGVIWKHAFRNATIPVVTFTALVIVSLFLAGSIVAETIFSYPGVGSLVIQSVRLRDFPQTQAAVLFLSFLYVVVSLMVDVLYRYLDPKIHA